MVVRFQLHRFCISLGIFICFFSMLNIINHNTETVVNNNVSSRRILIIDPGHGGSDGGAVGIDGVHESDINLQIAVKLDLLCKLCGIPTVMTRTTDDINYPADATSISEKKTADQNDRLRLIQDHPNAILYSIHQNAYPSEAVSGIHVLYGHNKSSRDLGNLLQTQFNTTIDSKTKRVAAEISEDIYLLKHCNCTAVLIECGFISNSTECKLLQNDLYQTKLTTVMLSGYLEYLNPYRKELS